MNYRLINVLILALAASAILFSSNAYSQASKPAAQTEFRTVTIVSEPRSSVWIDGVYRGKTNAEGKLVIATVPTGVHTLKLRADGFKEKSQPLTATQKGEIDIALVKTTDPAELAFQEAERFTTTDREAAAAAFRKAVSLRPNYPEAYIGLARVLTETGELEDAVDAVKSARKFRPGYAEASAVEGRIHREYGETDKAVAAFKRSIAEGKGFQPEAYTGLGLYYKERAEASGGAGDFTQENVNYGEAAKNLKVAVKQLAGAPDTIVIYQLLGLIYERQLKYKDAIATYEEFLRIFPNSIEATAVRSFIVQLKKSLASQD